MNILTMNTSGINVLGRLGENDYTQAQFDVYAWLSEYPEGQITLLNQRCGDTDAYPVAGVSVSGSTVLWVVSDTDLSREGVGRCELIMLANGTVAKSAIYMTKVLPALDGSAEAPEPWESWQTEFAALKDEAVSAAQSAQSDAQSASASASSASTDATTANQAASQAASSASSASTSASGASASASVAQTAKTAAESAQSGAESAQSAAETAASNASTSATNAAGSASQASQSATNAAGSATVAAQTLTQVQAEGAAQIAAIGAEGERVMESIPADYTQMETDVANLKSVVNVIDGEVNTYTESTATSSVDNWKLTDAGTSTYDASYKIDKYAVNAGDYVKIESYYKFQFQTGANAGVDPKVGDTYGVGTFSFQVPETAKYLIVSYNKSGTATKVYSVDRLPDAVDTIDKKVKLMFDAEWTAGAYINNSGVEVSNASFTRTGMIPLSEVYYGVYYELYLDPSGNVVSFYDELQNYIPDSGVAGSGNSTKKTGVAVYPDNAKYMRFSHCLVGGGVTNPSPVLSLKNIVETSQIAYNSVGTSNLKPNAVTRAKCDFIVHDPETNYINKSDYSNGYIDGQGAFQPNNGWRATGFCALLPNTTYYSGGLHGGYCAFYKADKTTVIAAYGAYAFTVTEFTPPAETAYARFSLNASSQTTDAAWINIKNEKPEDYGYILDGVGVSSNTDNPCDYDGREIAVFNKILCVGDSMTEGTFNHLDSGSTQWVSYAKYSYPTYLHKMTGVDVTNLGHGGQTSVQWYNTEKDNDLSGYDCAIIQLGINDFGTYSELGADTKTAFQNIITKLKTENKNIKIFVANIIPATSYSSSGYKDYSMALLEWLETTYFSDPSVIPVDIQQYGHTGNSEAYNAGHLTALGYRMLARDYIGFISDYIKNHGDVFREVQFIGTDYWYVNPNS